MTVSINGPVGEVRPNSWWRTTKPTSFSADQRRLIELLSKVPTDQGGKKGAWTTTAFVLQDGKCATDLADAIWNFQVEWKRRGLFRNIDGVVDPKGNTLRKLNELADGQVSTSVVADIVIRFIGGDVADPLTPDAVLPRSRVPAYKPTTGHAFGESIVQHPGGDRMLVRIGRTTKTTGSASLDLFIGVIGDLTARLAAVKAVPGKIYIFGSSSGGRNAIDFAQRLSAAGAAFRAHFIGVIDAPFFDPETPDVRPTKTGPDPGAIPQFKVTAPPAIRNNFFQTRGNHARETTFGRKVFSSGMKNEEIHGDIVGFTANNLNDQIDPGPNDDAHHVNASSEGNRRAVAQIVDDLMRGRALPPNVG